MISLTQAKSLSNLKTFRIPPTTKTSALSPSRHTQTRPESTSSTRPTSLSQSSSATSPARPAARLIVVCATLAGKIYRRISSTFKATNASHPATLASVAIHKPIATRYASPVTNRATFASTRTPESASIANWIHSPSDSPRLIAASPNAAKDFSNRPTRLAPSAKLHVAAALGPNRTARAAIAPPQSLTSTTTSVSSLVRVDLPLLLAFAQSVFLPALSARDYLTTALPVMERTNVS